MKRSEHGVGGAGGAAQDLDLQRWAAWGVRLFGGSQQDSPD